MLTDHQNEHQDIYKYEVSEYYSIKCETYAVCCANWEKPIKHILSKLSVRLLVINQVPNSWTHKFASLLSFLSSLLNTNTLLSSAYNFTFAFGTAQKGVKAIEA